jgi:hypothetical protein
MNGHSYDLYMTNLFFPPHYLYFIGFVGEYFGYVWIIISKTKLIKIYVATLLKEILKHD